MVAAVREAAADGKPDKLLPWLAEDARAVLGAEPAIRAASGKLWKVLPEGKLPPQLLPQGELVETTERGERAVVIVQRGKQRSMVPLVLEQGQWRIDLFAMPVFWQTIVAR